MAIRNGELVHECSPKHSCIGTARMKYDKETVKEFKKIGNSTERSKVYTKERRPNSLSQPNQTAILINMIRSYFIRWRKNTMKFN